MLDFKFEISDARKIARTLVAFSNTDGGYVFLFSKDMKRLSMTNLWQNEYLSTSKDALQDMKKGINIKIGTHNYKKVVDIFYKYGICHVVLALFHAG